MHPNILSIIDEEQDSNGGAIKLSNERDERNVNTDDSLVSHYLPVNFM